MSYSKTMTKEVWFQMLTSAGSKQMDALREGKDLYDKWYQMTYGLDNTAILALPAFQGSGMTAADVTAITFALSVFNDLHTALYNLGALTQADREGYLVPFI